MNNLKNIDSKGADFQASGNDSHKDGSFSNLKSFQDTVEKIVNAPPKFGDGVRDWERKLDEDLIKRRKMKEKPIIEVDNYKTKKL